MLDDDTSATTETTQNPTSTASGNPPDPATAPQRTRRRASSRPAGPPVDAADGRGASPPATVPTGEMADKPTKRVTKRTAKKVSKPAAAAKTTAGDEATAGAAESAEAAVQDSTPKKRTAKKAAKKSTSRATGGKTGSTSDGDATETSPEQSRAGTQRESADSQVALPLFQAPDPSVAVSARKQSQQREPQADAPAQRSQQPPTDADGDEGDAPTKSQGSDAGSEGEDGGTARRRRSRGGRNRRKPAGSDVDQAADTTDTTDTTESAGDPPAAGTDSTVKLEASTPAAADDAGSSHRRRRRRRSGDDSGGQDEATATTARVRAPKPKKDAITSVEGSTRIEAKKQRRREGREAGRRRPPILSESEFLARRESVERVMAIRQRGETTQIAVLEDDVLVEHYVALESQSSIIGNVYLARVQNVLPSMEAAFIDIGKGRNAVLYAGEVNWDLRDNVNQPRRIENALKPGQPIMVQVSKDPVGHKGARLTSQISLPGRYLVYVPSGGTSGISRKLPDTERNRLKNVLKEILPDDSGVIIRTAAEGASEEELTRDVTRLTARWEDIEKKSKSGQAPQLLYAEPDTTLKVVRDLFTEDFTKLVISGDDAWDMVDGYVQHVAPDLANRLERYDGEGDIFTTFRIDEQIAKALERKVWLPSGGSLVIDRTEAMTVVDVNTGKFTGSGGNLEETVTKNNLEAAEEMVRQLRLRDIGGIIVIDFIDMVLEDNRDLVLRRLVECLGRDRTRHQVAEVTSLGLVQMTRKRIGTGLIEAFSQPCEHCNGRGVVIEHDPVEPSQHEDHTGGSNGSSRSSTKRSSNRRRGGTPADTGNGAPSDTGARKNGGAGADDEPAVVGSESTPAAAKSTPDPTAAGVAADFAIPEADLSPDSSTVDGQDASDTGDQDGAPAREPAAESAQPAASSAEPAATSTASTGRRRRRASRPTGAPAPVSAGSGSA